MIAAFFSNNLHVTASATAAVLGYVPGVNASQPPACTGPTAVFTVINTGGLTIFANPTGSSPEQRRLQHLRLQLGLGRRRPRPSVPRPATATPTRRPAPITIILEVTNQGGSDR